MTAPGPSGLAGGPPARASFAKRYGPLIGIVVVIVLVAVVVTISSRGNDDVAATSPTGSTVAGGSLPVTYDEAKQAGNAGSVNWGDDCDTTTGAIKLPSVYAPACVPAFSGSNGGATAPGVTADTITVVYYNPALGSDLTALVGSQIDAPELVDQTIKGYQDLFNSVFETYGRKVVIKRYDAKAAMSDTVGAAADAQAVIDQFHPFASINGPVLTSAYSDELTRNGVACFNCGLALPDSAFQEQAPHMWVNLATPEQFLQIVSDYVQKRLINRPAEYAGGDLQGKPRTFGVVHFESDPPAFQGVSEQMLKCGAQVGWSPIVNEEYGFDLGKMPERATTIVAKLKAANVTTVVFLGDPLMPIFLTKAATAQGYFPEWVVTGTPYTDSASLARKYDPEQWKRAFGLSQLPVRLPQDQLSSWRIYEWAYGRAPEAVNTNPLLMAPIQQIFTGVHLAGPNLTPDTFRDALFRAEPAGGGPTTIHVSYGDHGYFKTLNPDTCQYEGAAPDYASTDDMTEIWWDAQATGPDEQGKEGQGLYFYANGGKRYLPRQMPDTPPDAFKTDGAISGMDRPAPDETPPTYPKPTIG